MTFAQKLAEWVYALDVRYLPEGVLEKTRCCVLDWLASVHAGSAHPTADRYMHLGMALGSDGQSPFAGRFQKGSLAASMLVNGAFGHITETDDGHRASIMHPGAVVFPVCFALAPTCADPGRALVEGAVAGYELAIRTGEALGPDHYGQWHTTATAGVFGAAAAAAKILGLNEKEIVAALGHAGTQSSGLWQFLDDGCVEAKPFHPGKACFDGYVAALAAAQGISGAHRIFEGTKGVLAALGRPAAPHFLSEQLGKTYKIMEANFKAYPTCGQTHSMLDALDALCRKHGLTAGNVRAITARVYQRAVQVAGNSDPKNLEEAKFSIAFCLACRLVRGEISFTGLSAESVHDPAIRRVMEKISVVVDDAMTAGFPAARPCVVEVCGLDGKIFSQANMHRRGDPENPMSFEDVAGKFYGLLSGLPTAVKGKHMVSIVAKLPAAGPGDILALL